MIAQIDDRQLRELLIKRYAGMDRSAPRHLLKFYLKRIGWTAVVRSTSFVKRTLDILLSALLLLLLLPLFLVVALAIWLENPGPVLIQQSRVGRWGKLFAVWSFRTTWSDRAQPGAEPSAVRSPASNGSPRLTRVGALLRQWHIDELPQLVNVIKGEMSLVGPRPPEPREVDRYSLADHCRLEITPGIWRSARQTEVRIDRLVELDMQYHQSQSLWTDLKLLGMLTVLIFSGGGYSATVSASLNGPAENVFSYNSSNLTSVDISLTTPDGGPALLAFYSEGPNGLRLLENVFTDADGHFTGDLRLPVHLAQVVVVVRTGERQDTLTLPIADQSISYME